MGSVRDYTVCIIWVPYKREAYCSAVIVENISRKISQTDATLIRILGR